MRFSIGIGNNTKLLVRIGGLSGMWFLIPTIVCGKILARKYESFKQVPVKDYFMRLNFLCFDILDIFIIRRADDSQSVLDKAKMGEQVVTPVVGGTMSGNRQQRRSLRSSRKK